MIGRNVRGKNDVTATLYISNMDEKKTSASAVGTQLT